MSKIKDLILDIIKKHQSTSSDDGYEPIEAGIGKNQPEDDYTDIEAGIHKQEQHKNDILEAVAKKAPKEHVDPDFNPLLTPHRYAGNFSSPLDHNIKLNSIQRVDSVEKENALRRYTGSGYDVLNSNLYKGKELDKNTKRWEPHLSEVIKDNKTPSDMVVYSGLKRNPKMIKTVTSNKEKKAKIPAYFSTSLDPQVARSFAKTFMKGRLSNQRNKHVLRLHVPHNSHALYAENYSDNPEESELILHKGSKIHIHPIPHIIERQLPGIMNVKYRTYYHDGYLVHDGLTPTRHARGFKK